MSHRLILWSNCLREWRSLLNYYFLCMYVSRLKFIVHVVVLYSPISINWVCANRACLEFVLFSQIKVRYLVNYVVKVRFPHQCNLILELFTMSEILQNHNEESGNKYSITLLQFSWDPIWGITCSSINIVQY